MLSFEDSNDELQDYEYPDEPEDDFESDTINCSECNSEVFADAEQCPVCGTYLTHSGGRLSSLPKTFVLIGILGIVSVIFMIIFGVW